VLIFTSFFNVFRIIALFFCCAVFYPIIGNKSIFNFFRLSGPSFIKLGQTLSCRPDLIGEKLATILANFQDKLPAELPKKINKILDSELKNHRHIFLEFSQIPVASASIAQVHKAKIFDNVKNEEKIVAVKILHSNIENIFARDVLTLKIITKIAYPFLSGFRQIFLDLIKLLEDTSKNELDLLKEAACATRLKKNLKDLKGFYIPEIYWQFSSSKILVSEWIDGIAFSDYQKIQNSNFDKKIIAHNLVISYFHQVYEDGFFHADMHPGNLFLMNDGRIAAVDFGIVGIIDKKTRIGVAEILIAFLNKNYLKVAKLHVELGLVPKDTDIDRLSLSCAIIGESIVDSDIKNISLAKLLDNLLKMTKAYKMSTRTDLLLLQKTLMLVEGVGLMLDKDLNMWELARPWIRQWAKRNIGFDAKIRDNLLELLHDFKNLVKNKNYQN
jgi:ubiquinone biosynthesis protein